MKAVIKSISEVSGNSFEVVAEITVGTYTYNATFQGASRDNLVEAIKADALQTKQVLKEASLVKVGEEIDLGV